MSDLIERQEAIDVIDVLCQEHRYKIPGKGETYSQYNEAWQDALDRAEGAIFNLPSAQPEPQWIPCSERLPKINQSVLLATSNGVVFIGHRTKPELIWQVTEEDGRKHWVYDPEAYTDDIESLPKGEDCAFDNESQYEDGALSVTSANYNPRFDGVVAWMPLPEPYRKEGE